MFLLLIACVSQFEPQVASRFLCSSTEVIDIGCSVTLATCLDTVDQDCFLIATSSCHGLAMLPVSCPDHT